MLAGLSSALRKALIIIGTAYLIAVIAIVLALCILIFFICRVLRQYTIFRRPREVRCPETNRVAIVQVDAFHACLTSFFDDPILQLSACSRWPERQNCDRACLRELEGGRQLQARFPFVGGSSINS